MKKIYQKELDEIIEKHEEWIKDRSCGERMIIEFRDLERSNFSKRNLKGAILNYCNLQFANFIGTNLKGVELKGSDLMYCDLTGSDLSCSTLTNSNLVNSKMERTNLKDADLRFTNLGNARLKGVNLTEALLYKTDLSYANIDNMISCGNLGEHNRVVYYFYKENRIKCGCFDGTLEEFESELLKKYKEDNNYFKALEMFKKIKNK